MKNLPIVIALALVSSVVAGTSSSKAVIPPVAQPSLWSWFAGASVGKLADFDETMWNVQAGANTPWKVAGWDVALFADYGSTETESLSVIALTPQIAPAAVVPFNVYQQLEIKPLTFNVKFERNLAGKLDGYFGAGLGVAFVDYTVKNPSFSVDLHDSDESFVFQAFAGLDYDLTEKLEVFAGARWISVDYDAPTTTAVGSVLSFDSDVLYEAGVRYTF